MGEGLTEMFNPASQTPGYPAVRKVIERHGHENSRGLINLLKRAGESRAAVRVQADDVTFVVIRVKP
ncbi:MAG: serine/threonine-protein phosphatase [Ignavibacteria bacterium]|nr:serine/threonine-protein phosphatase [Ignavibacteria bacterium]